MDLNKVKVLALVEDAFEDLELWYPVLRMREAGATVTLAGKEKDLTYTGKHGVPCTVDVGFKDVSADDFDVLLVPGGWAPDQLRRYPEVLDLVKAFDKDKKLIGQICHAGWVLISADVLAGVKVTSTTAIVDDLKNAGAEWVDVPVVTSGHIISSRRPPDLPDYLKAMVEYLEKA
ncbi:protease I [Streptohalobacillus salinus]|uniref:Protease I n=1 Tax=Streptohalobacillus salinus TaxID=621096 RepID=A0A2V3WKI9_9BACI|nr:type 1 glutamine amidotransferase domain-containing protein [Streptohalobacillus salinus]PXW89219.1 protease I [Streptohalobacillus salinus]